MGSMIRLLETHRILPFYRPVPLTNLPLLYHREHLFPYTSYGETEKEPEQRTFKILVLENDFVRVEVAPELGGRVYSLFDKRIGKEILFSNPVVKPVRILPIWAFISGGIEFNFPIAHSPTSIATVGCTSGQLTGYVFVRVGEREARTGMEWVVELGLAENCPALIQRTWLRNQTSEPHPWMMWTICAVPSTRSTEFIHPPHRVLVHDHRIVESDWPGAGLNWDRNYMQMTALFWKPGSASAFGTFHHEHGFGLMHLADPNQLPGKKLWTYGHNRHRAWGEATTKTGLSYCELESGPLLDQTQKPLLPSGAHHYYEEYWVPVHSRQTCEQVALAPINVPISPDPWLGSGHSSWQTAWGRFRDDNGPLPDFSVVTGMDLEAPLRRELERGNNGAAEPLALWLAFHARPREALAALEGQNKPTSRRLAGLILWKGLGQRSEAVAHLESGPLDDAIALIELDELYAELGLTPRRIALLASTRPSGYSGKIVERQADLALTLGRPAETLRLLQTETWPREHQRYVRSDLWKKAKAALGEPENEPPDFLNEDNLARFGAYWSD